MLPGRKNMPNNNTLKVQHAIYEKEIFIGYYMLCRYLNGKGYKRYGCNAGYDKKIGTHGKNRLSPCKILCEHKPFTNSMVRYHVKKLVGMEYVYIKKVLMEDSVNPEVGWYRNAIRKDVFVLIASTKKPLDKFIEENNCEEYKK